MRLLVPGSMLAMVAVAVAVAACTTTATSWRPGSQLGDPGAQFAARDEGRASVVATATRAPEAWEARVGEVVFDPALDCVARRLAGTLDVARYRTALPFVCGTPLYVVDARVVAVGGLATTIADMRKRFTVPVQVAVGTARAGDRVTVVIAARTIEMEPFRDGDRQIHGRLLVDVVTEGMVSSMAGVSVLPVTVARRAFTIDVATLDNADVELVELLEPERKHGARAPLARFRIGTGSPLFARPGSVFERTNDARARLGLVALRRAPGIGDCSGPIPGRAADIEITDLAHCYSVPGISTDALAAELAANPLSQLDVLGSASRAIEIGMLGNSAALRAFERFEDLPAAAARARVLAAVRARWPDIAVRAAPQGALDAILAKWSDVTAVPPPLTEELKAVAASWTPMPLYMSYLFTGRDVDVALTRIEVPPNVTPTAVEIAHTQIRAADGALHHLFAVMLAIPKAQ